MEPGHEDREYPETVQRVIYGQYRPQWSPVTKTGNTGRLKNERARRMVASMEPGHEDREYACAEAESLQRMYASMEPGHEDREYRNRSAVPGSVCVASMEPGHEDREYRARNGSTSSGTRSLNGARS